MTTGAIPEQSFAITPAQVAQLKAGLYYVNIHSTTFPGGEVRGQIVDTTPPICSYQIVAGNPKRIDFTVQDTGSGLASVLAPTANNVVTPFIPPVTAGTATPVTFSAVKINQALSSQVAIALTDVAGNKASCF